MSMRGNYIQENPHPLSRVLIAGIALIFVLLIFKFLGGNDDEADVSIKFSNEMSNAQLSTGTKEGKNINVPTALSPKDTITQKNGTSQITFLANPKNTINLNEGTILHFLTRENNFYTFQLENKDIWVTSDTTSLSFLLDKITLTPTSNSVTNISRNELFTTISVFQGSVSLAINGSTLEIPTGKQLNFPSSNTSQTAQELTAKITSINPDNLASPWMKLNNASEYFSQTTTPAIESNAGTGGLILFDSLIDESTVNTNTLTITGRILSNAVARITINGQPALIDPTKQTFSLASLELKSHENNIIYRTFNVAGTLLSKGVLTLYSGSQGVAGSVTTGNTQVSQLETYKTDNRFTIIAPSTDFYETRETNVKIEGRVTPGVAHSITVNGFRLSSFKPKGSTWHYFANQQFGFLQDGLNTYVIRYFDSQDTEIHKQLFIIKKLPPFTASGIRPLTVSGEMSR